MPENYIALKTEIALPAYNGMTDQQVADKVNTDTASVPAGVVSSSAAFGAFDATEFAALTQIQVGRLTVLMSGGEVDTNNANVRTLLAAIFPAGGPTRTALVNLASKAVPKWQSLGWSRPIDFADVARARIS